MLQEHHSFYAGVGRILLMSQIWPTTAPYVLQAKNDGYIFKWLRILKNDDSWYTKMYPIQISFSINRLYGNTGTAIVYRLPLADFSLREQSWIAAADTVWPKDTWNTFWLFHMKSFLTSCLSSQAKGFWWVGISSPSCLIFMYSFNILFMRKKEERIR